MLNGEERVWMERGTIMSQVLLRKRATAVGMISVHREAALLQATVTSLWVIFHLCLLFCRYFYRFNSHQAESGLIMFEVSKTFEKSTSFSGPVFAMATVLKYLTWGLNSASIS